MRVRYEGVSLQNRRETTMAGVTLAIPAGEIACFYGPTRTGKSSLLLITGGYLKPTAGRVYLGDLEVGTAPMQARRVTGLGIIPEFNPLLGNLSLQENLLFQSRLYGVKEPARRVRTLLQELDLAAAAQRRPDQLTQPETLRGGMAMALVHNPPVLLLDEPSHALTTDELVQQWPYIQRLKELGKTILVTSHSLWVARQADHCFLMPTGKEVHAHELAATGLARTEAVDA